MKSIPTFIEVEHITLSEIKQLSPRDRKALFRNELLFSARSVKRADANEWQANLHRRVKTMEKECDSAAAEAERLADAFSNSLNRVIANQNALAAGIKTVSTNARKAANEIGEAMQRLEKVMSLEKLERSVGTLERAAAALSTLAELERNGQLGRVIDPSTASGRLTALAEQGIIKKRGRLFSKEPLELGKVVSLSTVQQQRNDAAAPSNVQPEGQKEPLALVGEAVAELKGMAAELASRADALRRLAESIESGACQLDDRAKAAGKGDERLRQVAKLLREAME